MSNTLKEAPDLYTKPPVNAIGGARLSFRKYSLLTTDLITTQILALNVLPAGCRLIDAFVEVTDIDTSTTPAVVMDIGILNTYYGESAAGVSGVRLSQPTEAAQAAAAYASGGTTDTNDDPQIVSAHKMMSAITTGQSKGRSGMTATLNPSVDIGVDKKLDRIVAVNFTTAPTTAAAGTIAVGILYDRDQE